MQMRLGGRQEHDVWWCAKRLIAKRVAPSQCSAGCEESSTSTMRSHSGGRDVSLPIPFLFSMPLSSDGNLLSSLDSAMDSPPLATLGMY